MLLADEVNRTPPKTQAALLEAMEERQVPIEATRLPLPEPFLVLATQNPIEYEGTYPLPEAQLDASCSRTSSATGREPVEGDLPALPSRRGRESRRAAGRGARQLALALRQLYVCAFFDGLVRRASCRTALPRVELGASLRQVHLLAAASHRAARERGTSRRTIVADASRVLRHRLLLRPEAELER